MRLIIIRHGQSQGNVDTSQYTALGDSKIGLTDLGWTQAIAAGKVLKQYYESTQTNQWPYVFLSAYQRTQETLSGLVHGMHELGFDGEPTIHLDPRLIERFGGASYAMRSGTGPVDKTLSHQFAKMAEDTYQRDSFTTRNLLGESNKDIYMAVQSFMDGTLSRVHESGQNDMIVVCHGIVYREFVRAMGELPFTADLPTPKNCDILEATKDDINGWTVRQIYDGESATPVDVPLLDGHHPYSFSDLPPVPDHLQ